MSRIINDDLEELELERVEAEWQSLQRRWEAATDPAERQQLADRRDACLSYERYLRSIHSNPLATL
jgi:hypothetical protein